MFFIKSYQRKVNIRATNAKLIVNSFSRASEQYLFLEQYIFLVSYSYPRASLSENLSHLGTDNVRRQTSNAYFHACLMAAFVYIY